MDRFTYQYYYQANGQLMASYNSELFNGTQRSTILEEQYIYGSNRIGTLKANKGVYFNGTHQPAMIDIQSNKIGKKRYELTNHLGNVLATFTDRKIYNSTDGYYEPVITMKADYYAFGMLMPNRFEGVDEARHLFNGMEHDMEVSGNGNSYTTEFRQYDPRLGRWKSLDPLMAQFPWQSPYVVFDNNPIFYTDPLGLAAEGGGDEGEPVKKGSGEEIPLQGTFEEVQIIANKNPKTQQIKENVLMSKGKYADSKYDGYRTSLEAYLKSRSLIGENPNYSANDHINNYDRYGWSKYDLNNVVLTPEQHRELDAIWGDNYDLFIEKIKFGTAALVFIAAAPALPSAALAKGYIATSVGKGIVNATINWTVQYSLREDAGNIDYASVIISGGSGFLPGSTTRQIITSGLLVGGADGNIDYTINDGWSNTIKKSTSQRINESLWGAINIGGNNAFKTAPTWAKAWSSTVIETGTQGISYGINEKIEE